MSSVAAWDAGRLRRRVIFWRHGRTEWNAQGRFQGQEDIGLDEVGRQQAAKAARLLHALHPTRIISSDLRRAHHTGLALGELTGLDVTVDPRLRETFAGTWQGLTFVDIGERFPDERKAWSAGRVDARPGGGETRLEVGERITSAVLEAVEQLDPNGTLVVATHGGAARVGLAQLLGLPHRNWNILSGLSNCNWSVLEEMEQHDDDAAVTAVGNAAGDAAGDALGGIRWRLTEHNAGTLPRPVTVQEG